MSHELMTNDEVVTAMGWPPISGQTWLAPRRSYHGSNSAAPWATSTPKPTLCLLPMWLCVVLLHYRWCWAAILACDPLLIGSVRAYPDVN